MIVRQCIPSDILIQRERNMLVTQFIKSLSKLDPRGRLYHSRDGLTYVVIDRDTGATICVEELRIADSGLIRDNIYEDNAAGANARTPQRSAWGRPEIVERDK